MIPAFLIRWLIAGGVGLALVTGVWLHGYSKGKANVQAKWDAAEARALGNAVDAREKAERSIPDAAPAGKPCGVRDRFDRDCP